MKKIYIYSRKIIHILRISKYFSQNFSPLGHKIRIYTTNTRVV